MRLNKYIAHTGICSRREADKLISKGYVQVNGEVVTRMGAKVQPGDEVRFKGEPVELEEKVYLLLNKPPGCVTTVRDPHHNRTVMDFVKPDIKQRIYPVGRLDQDTTGVLLLTNDGQLTHQLTHPRYEVMKTYHVMIDHPVSKGKLRQLQQGVKLEDGPVHPDSVQVMSNNNPTHIKVELHSGKKRVIKRMFEQLGHKVTALERVRFAGLTAEGLNRGEWRYLSDDEVATLQERGEPNH